MRVQTPILSRISIRLLAFNILLVFLPAAGVLILDTYESHLLEAQERTMGQEGRLLAAALEADGNIESQHAQRILIQLGQRHQTRLRVIDRDGKVLADSATLGPRRSTDRPTPTSADRPPQTRLLYRIGSLPIRILRGLRGRTGADESSSIDQDLTTPVGPEVQAALRGRYGATTRVSSSTPGTVILHIAIPVRIEGAVEGAVLVSQSTSGIMSALYAVRLDVFKVFLASLAVAVVLTLLVATTISRPLGRLRRRAEEIMYRRGRLRSGFEASDRSDEIGDLERALAELTRRLEEHIQYTESFASDVSHEFKNPLAAIRSATDMALDVDNPEDRRRFLTMIQRDVARMERLLTEAREVSRVDAGLDEEEREAVALDELISGLMESFKLRLGDTGPSFEHTIESEGVVVFASPDRLTQLFENLISNAVSFSPPGGTVSARVTATAETAVVSVADQGSGVPPAHRNRIFSRFFSYRPDHEADRGHSGLGLALVKAIAEGYGGSVEVGDSGDGGAEFTVTLPRYN